MISIDGKRILVLGCSDSAIPLVNRAKELGLYVGVVDIREITSDSVNADEFFRCSIEDVDEIVNIARMFKPDGITCGTSDIGVVACSVACKELNLSSISVETAKTARNKIKMIELLEKNSVPHPKYEIFDSCKRISLNPPFIIKPSDGAASRGVNIVNNIDELYDAVQSSIRESRNKDLIVEEYIDGEEVSVVGIVERGQPRILQVNGKILNNEIGCAELGYYQPANLSKDVYRKVIKISCDSAVAIGIDQGCFLCDIRIRNNEPIILEINSRMSGDFISTVLLNLSTGIDLTSWEIYRCLGLEYDLKESIKKGSAVRFITPKDIKDKINIKISEKDIKNIYSFKIDLDMNRKFNNFLSNDDRLGYIISFGDTSEKARKIVDSFVENL